MKKTLFTALYSFALAFPSLVAAQTPASPGSQGIQNLAVDPLIGKGPGSVVLALLFARLLSSAFIIGGLALLAMIILAAFDWMTAGNDENKLKTARGRLSNAILGFVILVAFRLILGFVADTLEIPWLKTLNIVWPI